MCVSILIIYYLAFGFNGFPVIGSNFGSGVVTSPTTSIGSGSLGSSAFGSKNSTESQMTS